MVHVEAELDEVNLLLGREPSELDRHDPLDERGKALVRTRDQHDEDGERILVLADLGQELEARLVGPLKPFDDDDERVHEGDGGKKVTEPRQDDAAPGHGVLVAVEARPPTRHQLCEPRNERAVPVPLRGATTGAGDQRCTPPRTFRLRRGRRDRARAPQRR